MYIHEVEECDFVMYAQYCMFGVLILIWRDCWFSGGDCVGFEMYDDMRVKVGSLVGFKVVKSNLIKYYCYSNSFCIIF